MKAFLYCTLGVVLALAGLMAWGYYYASTHAAVDIQVEDSGFKSDNRPFGVPKGTVLELFDEAGKPLATAGTVEPWGYLSAKQPILGDCTALQGQGGNAYNECFRRYARWVDGWARRARFATLTMGACVITRVPVSVIDYGGDWMMWWFPLQHGSGRPYAYIQMHIRIDSRAACARAE